MNQNPRSLIVSLWNWFEAILLSHPSHPLEPPHVLVVTALRFCPHFLDWIESQEYLMEQDANTHRANIWIPVRSVPCSIRGASSCLSSSLAKVVQVVVKMWYGYMQCTTTRGYIDILPSIVAIDQVLSRLIKTQVFSSSSSVLQSFLSIRSCHMA